MFFFYSCINQDKQNIEIQIINDAFLQIVDTLAYTYNSLIPPPPLNFDENNSTEVDSKKQETPKFKNKLFIILADTLMNLNNWQKDTKDFISKNKALKDYGDFIKKKVIDQTKISFVNATSINNTGKYKLLAPNTKIPDDGIICGSVTFSDLALNTEFTKAAVVVTIMAGKGGVTKLVLLRKQKKWEVEEQEIFEFY